MVSKQHSIVRNNPRVSIGMPVYNGTKFLEAALDSLLAQTFEDFELIISDNASTDQTEAICRYYAARNGRIRYYRQEQNLGAIWNFNHVFEQSRGEYFKWAAYDDICSPTFLARCVELLRNNPSIVWCHTRSAKIDQHGRKLSRYFTLANGSLFPTHSTDEGHPRDHHQSSRPHKRFQGVLLGTKWCVDSYGLFRANVLRRTRMLLPYYGAEKVLIGEVSLMGRYHEVPETLFFQRIHTEAAGSLPSATQQQTFMNSTGRRHCAFTRLQLLKGHVGAILHTDLSAADHARCFIVILKYLLQVKKWKGIMSKSLTGAGIGGENLLLLQILDQESEKIDDPASMCSKVTT